jgi:hypothetical protein
MRCSNTNIESKKTLMKMSVKLQKQSTKEYFLAPIPKEPNKRVQGAENRERATGITAISNRRGNNKQMVSRGHPYMDNVAISLLQKQLSNNKHVERLTNMSGRVVVMSREGRDDVCMSYGGHKKLTEENVSKQLMAHRILFITQERDYIPVAQLPTHSRKHNNPTGFKMDAPSPIKVSTAEYRELRCHQEDIAYEDHSNANNKFRRRMVSSTPPVTEERGGIPDTQQMTHSRTCGQQSDGHQMAVTLMILNPETQTKHLKCLSSV